MADWGKLLNGDRRKPSESEKSAKETRTPFERDFDRILFSTPLRRLADKTQVFPLEKHASVRSRLTHSLEVSNLARSIGIDLAFNKKLADSVKDSLRNVPAMLAAIALVHDLGNPPFGHQGEIAIRDWFKTNLKPVLGDSSLDEAMKQDFLRFEGNAQTFRLVTRLQLIDDDFGLNLSFGTLSGLLKYTATSDKVEEKSANAGLHKPGFFQSEKAIVAEVKGAVNLSITQRHPLTYVMEACDDVCYAIMDAEDSVKKNLASYPDLADHLTQPSGDGDTNADNEMVETVLSQVKAKREKWKATRLSPAELNDLSMQMFRVYAFNSLVSVLTDKFVENLESLGDGTFEGDLVSSGAGAILIKRLKDFDLKVGYRHRSVLEIELKGHTVIQELMDRLWEAISARNAKKDPLARSNPKAAYIYGRISENYRRIFESKTGSIPIRYKEAQLLTDMISGMTDQFALSFHEELRALGI